MPGHGEGQGARLAGLQRKRRGDHAELGLPERDLRRSRQWARRRVTAYRGLCNGICRRVEQQKCHRAKIRAILQRREPVAIAQLDLIEQDSRRGTLIGHHEACGFPLQIAHIPFDAFEAFSAMAGLFADGLSIDHKLHFDLLPITTQGGLETKDLAIDRKLGGFQHTGGFRACMQGTRTGAAARVPARSLQRRKGRRTDPEGRARRFPAHVVGGFKIGHEHRRLDRGNLPVGCGNGSEVDRQRTGQTAHGGGADPVLGATRVDGNPVFEPAEKVPLYFLGAFVFECEAQEGGRNPGCRRVKRHERCDALKRDLEWKFPVRLITHDPCRVFRCEGGLWKVLQGERKNFHCAPFVAHPHRKTLLEHSGGVRKLSQQPGIAERAHIHDIP